MNRDKQKKTQQVSQGSDKRSTAASKDKRNQQNAKQATGGNQQNAKQATGGKQKSENQSTGGEQKGEKHLTGGNDKNAKQATGGNDKNAKQATGGNDKNAKQATGGNDNNAKQNTGGNDNNAKQVTGGNDKNAKQATGGNDKNAKQATGGNDKNAKQATGGNDNNAKQATGGDQDDMTSKLECFEKGLKCLREIFENDKGVPLTEMFSLPKEVKLNGYDDLVGVGEEIRRIKQEKDHLEKVLRILYTKVIENKENVPDKDQNTFKLPREMDKELNVATFYQYAEEMSNTFQELNGDVELASKLFAELYSLSSAPDANHREETQSNDQSTKGGNTINSGRRNDGATTTLSSEVSQNLQRNFEVVKKVLTQMKADQHNIVDLHCRLEELGHLSQNMEGGDENCDHRKVTESSDKTSARKGVASEGKTNPRHEKVKVGEIINEVEKVVRRQAVEIEKLKSDLKEAEKMPQKSQSVERTKLEKQVESLRTRLSELAGAKLIKDNPAITDLSDPNRPTKLGEHYSELYSNEWTDVFQRKSENKKKPEIDIIKNLLDILIEGFQYCKQIKDRQYSGLQQIIFFPASDSAQKQVKNAEVNMNEIFARHLTEAIKLSGDVTSEVVAKAFIQKKDVRTKFGIVDEDENYVIKCVKLCWLMLIQTPPVFIELSAKRDDQFDRETYREYTKKGNKIDFIVWPPLRLHKGGPLLVKGVAQAK